MADDLSVFDPEREDSLEFDCPCSPEIPFLSRGTNRRKSRPPARCDSPSSAHRVGIEHELDLSPSPSSSTTTRRPSSSEDPYHTTPTRGASEDQSILLEMKQMLSQVCERVQQNELVLKELQQNSVM